MEDLLCYLVFVVGFNFIIINLGQVNFVVEMAICDLEVVVVAFDLKAAADFVIKFVRAAVLLGLFLIVVDL